MKKLEFNDAEKLFLRSLNTGEPDEPADPSGYSPGKETSVEVPSDLLGKLLDFAEVSLEQVKQKVEEDVVSSESSSPWETRLSGADVAGEKDSVQVSKDAVAALQAFPIKTSFKLEEAATLERSLVFSGSDISETNATTATPEAPSSEEDESRASSNTAPATTGETPVLGLPKLSSLPGRTGTPPAPEPEDLGKAEPGFLPSQSLAASQVSVRLAGSPPLTIDEISSEVTDASSAISGIRQSDLQTEAQATSFVSRLTRLFSRRKLSKFLGALEVFQDLSSQAISQIGQRVKQLEFQAGTPIIRRGDVADCMYILAQGEVNIPILDKKTHRQYSIKLGPGQLFGEMALLTGERRFADVIAQTNCSCLVLHKQDVDDLLQQLPDIARLLTSILGKRLMQSGGIQEVGGYQILGQLGRGGMAFVFEAVHKRKDRVVAMKMLSHELVYQGDFAERFRMEAEVLASLRHPHIVDFIASNEAYATFFLIMEKLNGLDLNQRIERTGAFSSAETRDVIIQAAKALAYAHDHGIIHRDIKPSNIMFTESGVVKVGDFGLALQVREDGDDEASAKKAIEGTPTYMAPEQILRKPLDRRVDIYALGVVAYKMLIGKPPFAGSLQDVLNAHLNSPLPGLREQLPSISTDVDSFVRKATAKKPQHRFQDAREILTHFGVEQKDDALPPLGVRTLTFVFRPGEAKDVNEIIDGCLRQAAGLDGLQVHVSAAD